VQNRNTITEAQQEPYIKGGFTTSTGETAKDLAWATRVDTAWL